MKTVFIINPMAGQGKSIEKFISSIKETAEKLKADIEIYITKAVGDATSFVHSYCEKNGAARFIACGGDGTLGEVVNGERSDGIVQYWYLLDNSIIYAAKIGYDNGVSQRVRSSVIVEEIMNAIGFSNDTVLRQDSVIYEKYTENYALSEMDLILLKLLYHPSIKPDMTKDQCFDVIKKLYY